MAGIGDAWVLLVEVVRMTATGRSPMPNLDETL
jgi:hypothetical protein